MLDFRTVPEVPSYTITLHDGTVKSYDPVILSYRLKDLEGEQDPAKVLAFVNGALDVNVDAISALRILEDFTKFSAEHLEEPLKKVFGPEPSLTTTSDSPPNNSESSSPPSS